MNAAYCHELSETWLLGVDGLRRTNFLRPGPNHARRRTPTRSAPKHFGGHSSTAEREMDPSKTQVHTCCTEIFFPGWPRAPHEKIRMRGDENAQSYQTGKCYILTFLRWSHGQRLDWLLKRPSAGTTSFWPRGGALDRRKVKMRDLPSFQFVPGSSRETRTVRTVLLRAHDTSQPSRSCVYYLVASVRASRAT